MAIKPLNSINGFSVGGNGNIVVSANLDIVGNSVYATGGITAGNFATSGNLSVSGSANIGNIGTVGIITATGNITGGNLITSGSLSVSGNLNAGNLNATNANFSNIVSSPRISVEDLYSKRSSISVETNTIIDIFDVNEYRSAKYTIRAGDDTGYQAIEVLLVHDDSNSIITTYGSLSTTGNDIVILSTAIEESYVVLIATGTGSNTTVNLLGTYVPD